MTRVKSQLQKINAILDLLTDVNRILAQTSTQNDRLQRMQYERQKQQYLTQLNELLSTTTQPLTVSLKPLPKAA